MSDRCRHPRCRRSARDGWCDYHFERHCRELERQLEEAREEAGMGEPEGRHWRRDGKFACDVIQGDKPRRRGAMRYGNRCPIWNDPPTADEEEGLPPEERSPLDAWRPLR